MSRKVFIFDTTLRDGEQGSGISLGSSEKLMIAVKLAELGVDVIEAGFPSSSPGDAVSVDLISREIGNVVICALSRALIPDIDACVRALEKAKRPRIHTGIGVSPIHISGKFGDEKYGKTMEEKKETILQMAVRAVRHAKQYVDDVEFYTEDAGRADKAYLYQMVEAVVDAGATVINVPDTTGYTICGLFGTLIQDIFVNVPNIGKAIISVHCHNDLGLGLSNTLEGVMAGATQVEGTINGLGERAGNTALEEFIMAVHKHGEHLGIHTDIDTKQIMSASRLVSRIMRVPIPRNKAITGSNVFVHSSGIHQDGVLKKRETYEIIDPRDIGAAGTKILLTARSGRHALYHRLLELGYGLSDEQLIRAFGLFKMLADAKKQGADDGDLEDIAEMILNSPSPDVFSIVAVSAPYDGETGVYEATLEVVDNRERTEWVGSAPDGPIDAAVQAIRASTGTDFELVNYDVHSIGEGSDVPALVEVRIRHNSQTSRAKWLDTDTVKASAIAYAYAVFAAEQAEPKVRAERDNFVARRVTKPEKLDAATRYPIPEFSGPEALVVGVGRGKISFFRVKPWRGGSYKSKGQTYFSIPPGAVTVSFPRYKRDHSGRYVYGIPEFYFKDVCPEWIAEPEELLVGKCYKLPEKPSDGFLLVAIRGAEIAFAIAETWEGGYKKDASGWGFVGVPGEATYVGFPQFRQDLHTGGYSHGMPEFYSGDGQKLK